jgi:hypothetical protein
MSEQSRQEMQLNPSRGHKNLPTKFKSKFNHKRIS